MPLENLIINNRNNPLLGKIEEKILIQEHHNLWGGWPDIWHGREKLFDLRDLDHKPLRVVQPLVPHRPVHIIDGSLNALVRFLSLETQMDTQGRYRYLLTGGVAVELVTGFVRHHKDLALQLLMKGTSGGNAIQ